MQLLSVAKLCPFLKQLVSFFPPLQIEVVNTFKSGTSFQGALRRQSSVTSQNQDVTNISSPSHVSLSNALSSPTSTPAAAVGRECVFLLHLHTEMLICLAVTRLSHCALSHLFHFNMSGIVLHTTMALWYTTSYGSSFPLINYSYL